MSAGLSEPSSTRLLADLLGRGDASRCARRTRDGRGRRAAPARPRGHRRPADRVPDRRARRARSRRSPSADAVIAVTPVFSASYSGLFKTFFDVLEPGTPRRHAGADRRDGRHGPALARARARAASVVQLPARGRRADGCLRRERGLGHAAGVDGTLRAGSTAPPPSSPRWSRHAPPPSTVDQFDRDVADMGDFEALLGPDARLSRSAALADLAGEVVGHRLVVREGAGERARSRGWSRAGRSRSAPARSAARAPVTAVRSSSTSSVPSRRPRRADRSLITAADVVARVRRPPPRRTARAGRSSSSRPPRAARARPRSGRRRRRSRRCATCRR